MPHLALPARLVWPLLAVLQALALGRQVAGGFRPGRAAPGRVALSWDMFAPPVARCTVTFVPPLTLAGASLPSLAALAPPREWDLVYDEPGSYRAAAAALCAARDGAVTAAGRSSAAAAAGGGAVAAAAGSRPGRAAIVCWHVDGHVSEQTVACP